MDRRDKKIALDLIREEFLARRKKLKKNVSEAEVAVETQRMIRSGGFRREWNALKSAEWKAIELRRILARKISSMYEKNLNSDDPALTSLEQTSSGFTDDDGCDMRHPQEILNVCAIRRIDKNRNVDEACHELLSEERRLMAQISVCTTDEELKSILKSAGLV